MKRLVLSLTAATALAAAASSAALGAPASAASVVIHHQVQHCHAWSFNRGAYGAALQGTLAKGGSLTLTNNDLMPHTLIQRAGPKASFAGSATLGRMGARVTVHFPKAGAYTFTTRPGEDYPSAGTVATTGADNVLTLKVIVA